MSEITFIYRFIIWANDLDYQNFPNYLNDHHPWTQITLKLSNFQIYLNVPNYLDLLIHYLRKWPRLPKFPKLPEWPQSLDSYHSQTIKISKITWMSEITLINWFIIWANDPDYLNYLNYHNPWTPIILKWSKFPKLPKCPEFPWSTDSLTWQMTQITKISQITRMTIILELKSLSNWLKF